MRIGIFGGTFDPPHLGHLILASEALDQLKLDRLLWVLTSNPPHKLHQPVSPSEQRLELVRAALCDEPRFELSRVDLDRPGPHYAVDTVRLLQAQFAGAEWFYLMGADSLRDLPTWYHPQELVEQLNGLGVMRRPGVTPDLPALARQLPGIEAKIGWIETPRLEISSTEIRRRIGAGRPYRYFLPAGVFERIEAKKFYQP